MVCFDERPCFPIGDLVEGLDMEPGKAKKEHYAYSKHGSCCVLAMIEPKTGERLAHVRRRRTARESTRFMQHLARLYPGAEKIIVVLDNLNAHEFSSSYKHLPARQAEYLVQRSEFIHTPKGASWLNMIEIEFSALSGQCLVRRIPSMGVLGQQVLAYFKERSDSGGKIDWSFSAEQARTKLNRHYVNVNPLNLIYKQTFVTEY